MSKRGRRTVASEVLEELGEEIIGEGCYLVFYDFQVKPSFYFYKNLQIIQDTLGDGVRIQSSVMQCSKLKTARAIEKLAKRYEAKVLVFKAEPV